jgi:hypothetical protein
VRLHKVRAEEIGSLIRHEQHHCSIVSPDPLLWGLFVARGWMPLHRGRSERELTTRQAAAYYSLRSALVQDTECFSHRLSLQKERDHRGHLVAEQCFFQESYKSESK